LAEIRIGKTSDVQCESEPLRRIKCNEIGNRLKSIIQPSETISQEDEISDNDLADDTKWVRVENSKKKRKLADRKSEANYAECNYSKYCCYTYATKTNI
jgi:hypothetical protein